MGHKAGIPKRGLNTGDGYAAVRGLGAQMWNSEATEQFVCAPPLGLGSRAQQELREQATCRGLNLELWYITWCPV